jgi:hypothetical protein
MEEVGVQLLIFNISKYFLQETTLLTFQIRLGNIDLGGRGLKMD